jgi:hypothetical protein
MHVREQEPQLKPLWSHPFLLDGVAAKHEEYYEGGQRLQRLWVANTPQDLEDRLEILAKPQRVLRDIYCPIGKWRVYELLVLLDSLQLELHLKKVGVDAERIVETDPCAAEEESPADPKLEALREVVETEKREAEERAMVERVLAAERVEPGTPCWKARGIHLFLSGAAIALLYCSTYNTLLYHWLWTSMLYGGFTGYLFIAAPAWRLVVEGFRTGGVHKVGCSLGVTKGY